MFFQLKQLLMPIRVWNKNIQVLAEALIQIRDNSKIDVDKVSEPNHFPPPFPYTRYVLIFQEIQSRSSKNVTLFCSPRRKEGEGGLFLAAFFIYSSLQEPRQNNPFVPFSKGSSRLHIINGPAPTYFMRP